MLFIFIYKATEGFAGSSPTVSNQICIASSEVKYFKNFAAASFFHLLLCYLRAFAQKEEKLYLVPLWPGSSEIEKLNLQPF